MLSEVCHVLLNKCISTQQHASQDDGVVSLKQQCFCERLCYSPHRSFAGCWTSETPPATPRYTTQPSAASRVPSAVCSGWGQRSTSPTTSYSRPYISQPGSDIMDIFHLSPLLVIDVSPVVLRFLLIHCWYRCYKYAME